eukprot:Gb_02358 [translate_table: standard]
MCSAIPCVVLLALENSVITSTLCQWQYLNWDITLEDGNPTVEELVPSNQAEDVTAVLVDGFDWVEIFVREMKNASNIDDARKHSSRALEALEKTIMAGKGVTAENFPKDARLTVITPFLATFHPNVF